MLFLNLLPSVNGRFRLAAWTVLLVAASMPGQANAQTLPTVPLTDFTPTTFYKGLSGYLYGEILGQGSNTDDVNHHQGGLNQLNLIQPLCPDGSTTNCLTSQKKIGVVTIGMSHWTKELCTEQPPNLLPPSQCDPYSFIYKMTNTTGINPSMVLVDCAQDGHPAEDWINDTVAGMYSNCANNILPYYGLTEHQVQVILLKQADSGQRDTLVALPQSGFVGCPPPTIPPPNGIESTYDACYLMNYIGQIARFVETRYTDSQGHGNVRQMFVHARIYAGYSNGINPLNPEPFAYEQGLALKWIVQSQIDEVYYHKSPIFPVGSLNFTSNPPVAPWIDWGTYLWANGATHWCSHCTVNYNWVQSALSGTCPANEECDYQTMSDDGSQLDDVHPSACGRDKVSNALLKFYCTSPVTTWFRPSGGGACQAPTALAYCPPSQ
jgi:hypothetical protein